MDSKKGEKKFPYMIKQFYQVKKVFQGCNPESGSYFEKRNEGGKDRQTDTNRFINADRNKIMQKK